MLIFFGCTALLILGYFSYGALVDRLFGPDTRETPAMCMADGVDYVPMSKSKIFLIQLLNIAGLGPVFGPILGALYGPSALLWIVFGTLLSGGFPTCRANFDVTWRYFGWANQTLAAIVLWTAAAYCIKRGKNHWIATIPAFFMTIVTDTYLCNAKIGFNMPMDISTIVGVISGVAALALFLFVFRPSAIAKMAPDNA